MALYFVGLPWLFAPLFVSAAAPGSSGIERRRCPMVDLSADRGSLAVVYLVERVLDVAQCCAMCAEDERCGHFTYIQQPDGASRPGRECRLMVGRLVGSVQKRGAITGEPVRANDFGRNEVSPTPVLGFRPHIVYMLFDDVGHYNMGWRGNPEARTPTMDELVAEGVVLDHMYTFQFCSPTRSSLLSGRLPIHVNQINGGPSAPIGIDLRMSTVADKLKEAGYATHQVGKWNVGSLAWGSMPSQRGFDTSYGYLGGEEDHYSQEGMFGVTATFGIRDAELLEGYSGRGGVKAVDLWDTDSPAYGRNGTYNAFGFSRRAVDIIEAHDPDEPLFMYLAWQNAHTPNQVPGEFLGPILTNDRGDQLRRTYEAMVHCLDSGVRNVTNALRRKGMWNRTLIVFSSDNGGREDLDFGGNNFPLRGMKFTDFQGGVRVTSWAAGGVIPPQRRGAVEAGLIHICDWYATFCALAGVSSADSKALQGEAAAIIPPVDSLSVWEVVASGAASPRTLIPLSSEAIIAWPYKLVRGNQKHLGIYTSPLHPNGTVPDVGRDPGCSSDVGCLFNLREDPEERRDLAALSVGQLQRLTQLLEAQAIFQTSEIPGYTNCTTATAFIVAHHGYGGPLCYKGPMPARAEDRPTSILV